MTEAASRRTFLRVAATSGAALLVGLHIPLARAAPSTNSAPFAPNAFIRIDPEGLVTLIMPQVEVGQGVYTSVAMILAEELDADWNRVRLEAAPPDQALYVNPLFGIQVTGSSNSIRAFWMPLRKAAASAREMLIQAAAHRWRVSADSCSTQNGEVLHEASGRRLAYGGLAAQPSALARQGHLESRRRYTARRISLGLYRQDVRQHR